MQVLDDLVAQARQDADGVGMSIGTAFGRIAGAQAAAAAMTKAPCAAA